MNNSALSSALNLAKFRKTLMKDPTSSLGSRMSSLGSHLSGGSNYFEADFSLFLDEIDDEDAKEVFKAFKK